MACSVQAPERRSPQARSLLTLAHVLCHNVDRFLRHHSVQLYQFLVPQFLHDLGLLQEGLRRHGAWLQGFDGNPRGAVPGSCGGVTVPSAQATMLLHWGLRGCLISTLASQRMERAQPWPGTLLRLCIPTSKIDSRNGDSSQG